MTSKKGKKNITLDDLAGMVGRGFQEVTERIGNLEIGQESLKREHEALREEVNYGFKKLEGSIERVGRRQPTPSSSM